MGHPGIVMQPWSQLQYQLQLISEEMVDFRSTGPRVTIDGHEMNSGSFEMNSGSFTITLTNGTAAYPEWPTSARSLSSIGDINVSRTLTLDVDRETTYEQMMSFAEAPAVTFQMTREFGDPDPFFETPSGWRGVLMQMARIVSFEFRKAAGRVEPHVRQTITIPDMRFAAP